MYCHIACHNTRAKSSLSSIRLFHVLLDPFCACMEVHLNMGNRAGMNSPSGGDLG